MKLYLPQPRDKHWKELSTVEGRVLVRYSADTNGYVVAEYGIHYVRSGDYQYHIEHKQLTLGAGIIFTPEGGVTFPALTWCE